uniref:Peptidase C14 caspase domain-containing protein n=1 Tax=viral metagenome TaxID=1070528 RepID=A0A6C0IH58_9ZZZZ
MGDIQQITNKYNKLIFQHIFYCNTLIQKTSLSRNSIGTKISTINSIKSLSNTVITKFKTSCMNEIIKFNTNKVASVPANVPTNVYAPTTVTNFINKKSLHIGINYYETDKRLNGCVNDAHNISDFIKNNCGFRSENIRVLTDEQSSTIKPTKNNILEALTNLLNSSTAGDLLFFTYSGHGTSTLNVNTSQKYNQKTELVPSDYKNSSGEYLLIKDTEIKILLDTYLKSGVTLFALIDACNSGTVFDLKYQYTGDTSSNQDTAVNTDELVTKGQVIMISGCTDFDTSADTFINNVWEGALSWSFLDTLSNTKNISWIELLTTIRTALANNGYTQQPQLSSGLQLVMNDICPLSL